MDEDRETVAIEVNDPPPEPEAVAEIADALEAESAASVEIARIEADRDTEIVETQAEAAVEIAEAAIEEGALERRLMELETWRDQHGPPDHPAIWEALRECQAMILSLSERLTPPPTPEPSPESNPASEGRQESERGEPGPTPSEPRPASEPEKPASAARKTRWI